MRSISSADFNYLMAYHSYFPVDGTREDHRHGILCSVFAGGNPNSFIPKFYAPLVKRDPMDALHSLYAQQQKNNGQQRT